MATTINSVSDLQDLLGGHQVAMVSTVDERGTLSSRPVTVQRLDDSGDLWFLVDRKADWVAPLDGSGVNASLVDEGSTWLSFAGRGSLVSDAAVLEDLGDPMSDTYFGEGAEPVALRIVSDAVEWWTAPGKVSQTVELAKAKLTGETPDLGDSGTLQV